MVDCKRSTQHTILKTSPHQNTHSQQSGCELGLRDSHTGTVTRIRNSARGERPGWSEDRSQSALSSHLSVQAFAVWELGPRFSRLLALPTSLSQVTCQQSPPAPPSSPKAWRLLGPRGTGAGRVVAAALGACAWFGGNQRRPCATKPHRGRVAPLQHAKRAASPPPTANASDRRQFRRASRRGSPQGARTCAAAPPRGQSAVGLRGHCAARAAHKPSALNRLPATAPLWPALAASVCGTIASSA
mmetsp:Transcript_49810/g.112002  ORF Transcript_49810/g.112002 Transcript_49810/m.112002 type:complete len:244 (+) Transcript_49810:192-923(+)